MFSLSLLPGVHKMVILQDGIIYQPVNITAMNALNTFIGGTITYIINRLINKWINSINIIYKNMVNKFFKFFYLCSHKPGHKLYEQWSSIWEREAGDTLPPRASQFMADMWLPIWVQCTNEGCGHWRKLPAHIELHHVKLDVVKCSDCSLDEDPVSLINLYYYVILWAHFKIN